ncbi:GNAT family N-acetyltransferase [Candidatus Aerophobetes bacterium]|uniref:GNAT family N-acetyltransferase n=1 Tax=Aerophobetes bacterium TaxID=2030807 RepID=A0A2A4YHX6_UNCAE|nr:MAG: GNAT family N-acetyltransferase [Candidatus Aerophobetes bacterium]
MSQFHIEKVTAKEDFNKAIEIRRKVFIEEQNVPIHEEIDIYEEAAVHYLVFVGDTPVATLRFRLWKGYLKIERAATLKEHRGKGIMTKLLVYVQEEGLKLYPDYLLFIHAQYDVLKFYEKLGWVAVGPVFDESKIKHQVMIFLPDSKEKIKNLKCLQDPEVPSYVARVLWTTLKE